MMLHSGWALLAGSHVLRTIALNKEVEIAPIERKSAVVTADSESYLIRLSSPEGLLVTLHVIQLHELSRTQQFNRNYSVVGVV